MSLILDGISTVAKKKRMAIKLYKDIDRLPEGISVVVLICASLKWATDTIERLNDQNIHPLLFGFQYVDTMYQYSGITLTYTKTTYQLTKYILAGEGGKTAFVGYNEDSLPDKLKLMGMKYAVKEAGEEFRIFKSHGDVNACIEEFAENGGDIRNVVCANDSIAMVIRSSYPHLLEGKKLCSCSGLKISELMENPHPTTKINYFKAGTQIAELYLFLLKGDKINSTIMTLEMDIYIGKEILSSIENPKNNIIYSRKAVDFYGDKNIQEVENLDLMLLNCDETDMNILKDMTEEGLSYEKIAEKYYLAANTVKYRVHAMMRNARVESKKDLLACIRKYNLKF